jgi:hypothetical protein
MTQASDVRDVIRVVSRGGAFGSCCGSSAAAALRIGWRLPGVLLLVYLWVIVLSALLPVLPLARRVWQCSEPVAFASAHQGRAYERRSRSRGRAHVHDKPAPKVLQLLPGSVRHWLVDSLYDARHPPLGSSAPTAVLSQNLVSIK